VVHFLSHTLDESQLSLGPTILAPLFNLNQKGGDVVAFNDKGNIRILYKRQMVAES
jgi:hypothetical protein